MVTKKQAVLLEEFGAEPVLAIISQCCALTVFRSRRILRDDLKCQFVDGGQAFGRVLVDVSAGVFLLQRGYLGGQDFKRIEEKRVSENRPAIYYQCIVFHFNYLSSASRR